MMVPWEEKSNHLDDTLIKPAHAMVNSGRLKPDANIHRLLCHHCVEAVQSVGPIRAGEVRFEKVYAFRVVAQPATRQCMHDRREIQQSHANLR